jgi:hypothetical protein
MKFMKDDCRGISTRMPDLLLDPDAVPGSVHSHIVECDRCRTVLDELRSTMALMDEWQAPEPNPYFLARLDVRVREERQAEPASWLMRWITRAQGRLAYGPDAHVRPLAAMALTAVLLLSGGTYMGTTSWDPAPAPPGQAAVVNDLETMDQDAQLLDQLEALSTTNGPSD